MSARDEDVGKRASALRMAREAIGLPHAEWCETYPTDHLELAAGYLKSATMALQCELARRANRLTAEMLRDYKQQRADVAASYSDPSMALCGHGMRPGVCPDC